jgi:hypothetical protein
MTKTIQNKQVYTVFINDVNSRKAFDVVNIVQNQLKYPITLAAPKDNNFQLPIIYSRKIYRLRCDELDNFKNDIKHIEDSIEGLLVFIPVSEKATRFFMMLRDNNQLSKRWRYSLPTLEVFNLTSDKWTFQQFCEKHNHPVPRSYTEQNFKELKSHFRSVILKPKSGQGSVGIKYFEKPEELPKVENIDWETNLIQEKIIAKKRVAGAFFFRHQGKICSEYCHQRMRTFPPEGGVTVYSQTVIYPEILEIGRALLDNLDWEGLAMIEFMFDETSQTWRIIELNPRLWGSILLSAYNGSAMLGNYIEASLKNEIQVVEAPQTLPVYIRWFFPFELLSFIKGKLSAKEFFRFNLKETCYVNFTYASFMRSLFFLIYFIFNISSIKRFIKKLST